MKNLKSILGILDNLNKSIQEDKFEAQNLDAVKVFSFFNIETEADYDVEEASEAYSGIGTRYGRYIYELLCKANGIKFPYSVQETIGGWAQNSHDFQTFEEACEYARGVNVSEVLPSVNVEVDYL